MGMTYTIGSQVYLGVDNSTVISGTGTGRKSIWLESNTPFLHGVLVGDFAHVPGSICGLWPGLYVVHNPKTHRDSYLIPYHVAGQSGTRRELHTVKSTSWKDSAISHKHTQRCTLKSLMEPALSRLPRTNKGERVIRIVMTAEATSVAPWSDRRAVTERL